MFPTLKTGAVMQYPATKTLLFNTDAIRFLDGTEQRFRDNPSVLHQWTIALDLLELRGEMRGKTTVTVRENRT